MARAAIPTPRPFLKVMVWFAMATSAVVPRSAAGQAESAPPPAGAIAEAEPAVRRIEALAAARLNTDLAALETYRPSYRFWRHIFAIPDGSVAFGSATDGRLLAVFRATDEWTRNGRWEDATLAGLLQSLSLPRGLEQRREQVAQLIAESVGPVVHNPTRGRFLQPNVSRYGVFLDEWSKIYERFGVSAELGLAQAVVESGLNGTIRSEANAVGFCQWLRSNWKRLDKLSPHTIEAQNQTTQAPYCAAYLSILATRYGSYIPALSEHHAGGTNVGRVLNNGARLGAEGIQAQYFKGSRFAIAVRDLHRRDYSELYRTYGPRSFRYTELVFGNMATIAELRLTTPQQPIHAMRTTRSIPLAELTRRTGLSAAELKRYNPALLRQVPARATVYLPKPITALGSDVAFWHRPANPEFAATLADFLALSRAPEEWDEPSFLPVLRGFQRRFERTASEEGTVMATVLAYLADDILTSRRNAILKEYRTSPKIADLFERAVIATATQQP